MAPDRKKRGRGRTDWGELATRDEETLEKSAVADVDAQPIRDAKELTESSRVRILRLRLGLTQEEFARRFHLSLASVRDWEQQRSNPDQSSRTLLRIIEAIPELVERVLTDGE